MKPHPRIRKTVKWGGAVVTVLLAAMWIGSIWWGVSWTWSKSGWVVLAAGKLRAWHYAESARVIPQPGWRVYRVQGFSWGLEGNTSVKHWFVGILTCPHFLYQVL